MPSSLHGPPLIPRADEHEEAAHGVRSNLAHHVVGIDYVAPALAHLLVVGAQDHALVEQPQERFVNIQHPHVAQGLDEESAVQ